MKQRDENPAGRRTCRRGTGARQMLVCLAVLAATVVAGAAAENVDRRLTDAEKAALAARMKTVYEQTRDYSADFRELRRVAGLKTPLEYRGTLHYRKDTLLFLAYDFPVVSVMQIKNGKALLWVDESPVADRMNIGSAGDLSGHSDLFGWNPEAFEGEIMEAADRYVLVPRRTAAESQHIQIEIDKETLTMTRLLMESATGDRTEMMLSGMRVNQGLPQAVLQFRLPEGTRVNDITQP